MRIPLPTNRLVTLALVGALLTGIVAVGLALPSLGGSDDAAAAMSGETAASDVPTANANFTPAVSTQNAGSGEYEEHEEHEAEEHEDEEHEDEEHEDEEHEG